MKLSYNWLKDLIDISASPEELSDVLTQTGLEVEALDEIEKIKGGMKDLVVGEIITCDSHPDADKLSVCKVDVGQDSQLEIVCGAPNVEKGQKVIVAPVNTTIYPTAGDPFKIKKAKIRGVTSYGMICAEDEIGLGSGHEGILVLDTEKSNGTPVSDLFTLEKDHVYEIGLTPNRGDAASHLGAARDLRAFYDEPLKELPESGFAKEKDEPVMVEVLDTKACPRYSGITIRDLRVETSPDWLQWRLKAIGQEPINNIVDITNYILHGLGQPLHAFDAKKIKGKVIVRTLPEGTKFTTLDEKERKLSDRDLMICDEKEGLCIAGVFGGIGSGITESTTDIFLESAFFSPDFVRATSLRHGLTTDASFRFERATDPEMTVIALKQATQMILDIAGGYVSSDIIDIYPEPIRPVEIKAQFSMFDKLIGESLPHDRILNILNLLDIETKEIAEDGFTALVPSYRSEVTRQADLVEEVLRIHGFNNIALDQFASSSYLAEFQEREPYRVQEKISIYLAGVGFNEIITNSLTSLEYESKLNLSSSEVVQMMNYSSEDLSVMKSSMLYTGLETVRHNLNRRSANLQLFEFGRTYHKEASNFIENEWLSLYLTGKTHEESWMDPSKDTTFFHLKGQVISLINWLGNLEVSTARLGEDKVFQYGLSVSYNEIEIGRLGLLNQGVLDHFSIGQGVFYAELKWKKLLDLTGESSNYKPISKYPEVKRDLSLVLKKSISFDEIEQIAFNSEKKLLNRINVFSTYEGEQLDQGQKSYAISFYLQDQEKTLTDKQIDKVMSRLMNEYETKLGAIIRK